jgi:hypothetical protein
MGSALPASINGRTGKLTVAAAIPYGLPGPRAAPMYHTTIPITSPATVPICHQLLILLVEKATHHSREE